MELDEGIARLVADPNISDTIAERVLASIYSKLSTSSSELADDLRCLLPDQEFDEFRLAGPTALTNCRNARVMRVQPMSDFIRYFLSPTYGYMSNIVDTELVTKLIRTGVFRGDDLRPVWLGRSSTAWVTLAEEVLDRSPTQVMEDLGAVGFGSGEEPLVGVSYVLRTDRLRVPTLLDARFDPAFVPKTSGDARAWNWHADTWGISEFVHEFDPRETMDIQIHLIGTPSVAEHGAAVLAGFKPNVATKEFVRAVLEQLAAHRDLSSFLDGRSSVIDLEPFAFERFIASLYARSGYHVTVTQASCDGGFDVIAVRHDSSEETLLIQAKKTNNTVGIRVLRELIGARFLAPPSFSRSVLVVTTTASFSPIAIAAASAHATEIRLEDFAVLETKLRSYREVGVRDIVEATMRHRNEVVRGATG